MRAIEWDGGDIVVIDQTLLPAEQNFIRLRSTTEVVEAIRSLRVRGAPALGIVGAYGVAQAALLVVTDDPKEVVRAAEEAGEALKASRPTAVNLGWAIERVLTRARTSRLKNPEKLVDLIIDEAHQIRLEDEEACAAIAKHAFELFEPQSVVLTHCNTGALVTGGIGTALGAIRYAHESGLGIAVVATETRPLLQGARLTAWELARLNIPHALVVDGAAPSLIARGEIHLVIVGADRIAANGDVANKIGTYPLALAAREAGIPFVVAAPISTIDAETASGADIPVEERDAKEVTRILGAMQASPEGTRAFNPAFDVTPAGLVTAIVTERGIARAPYKRSLARMLNGSAKAIAGEPQKGGAVQNGTSPNGRAQNGKSSKGKPSRSSKSSRAGRARPRA